MKRQVLTTLVALSAVMASGAACAQQAGFYGGASLVRADIKPDEGGNTYTPTAIALTLGNQIDKHIAAELRVGFSMSSDSGKETIQGVPVDVDVKLKDYMGVYVKGFVPITLSGALYGVGGYTSAKTQATLKANGQSASTTENDSSLAFGVGGSFAINRMNFITIEWMRLLSGDDYKINTLSAGFNMRF